MKVVPVDLANRRQVRAFIELPFRIYRDLPQWVPPLEMDIKTALNPRKHPYYRHSEAACFLAQAGDGRFVGRIMALDNRRYNEFNHERTAFFYFFECEDDPAASGALFDAAFAWARARGLDKMIGPKGMTPLDGAGILVEGFEHRPAFGMPYTPPYYPKLIEAAGFRMHRETVSGFLSRETAVFPERVHELAARVRERRGLRIRSFKKRSELRGLVAFLKELYNNSLSGTRENFPLTEADVAGLADQLLWFADPALIKLVVKVDEAGGEERPVGFVLGYPDISAALQRTRGRLLPFGWIDLLRELRRTPWVNLNGVGLVEEYRGLGGTAILFSEIARALQGDLQYQYADLVQIGVENENMQREMRNFGIRFYKRHRVYIREL